MIDKYQVYMLYKSIKKMWNAKRFNTNVFNTFFEDTLENFLINSFINDNSRVEYMSNYAIKLVNEINCNLVDIEHWTMYVLTKCLCDKKCPELADINSINKIRSYMIFDKRPVLSSQMQMINQLIAERNEGVNEFADTRFSLYDLDDNQENQAYIMYKNGQLDPEFYIRGLKAGMFNIDKEKIKDIDYKKFVTFAEMILKLDKEISDKNVS